jgi:hypothetical protein
MMAKRTRLKLVRWTKGQRPFYKASKTAVGRALNIQLVELA